MRENDPNTSSYEIDNTMNMSMENFEDEYSDEDEKQVDAMGNTIESFTDDVKDVGEEEEDVQKGL